MTRTTARPSACAEPGAQRLAQAVRPALRHHGVHAGVVGQRARGPRRQLRPAPPRRARSRRRAAAAPRRRASGTTSAFGPPWPRARARREDDPAQACVGGRHVPYGASARVRSATPGGGLDDRRRTRDAVAAADRAARPALGGRGRCPAARTPPSTPSLGVADLAARSLTPAEVDEALAPHPRIGERPAGLQQPPEQAASATDDPALAEAIAAGNAAVRAAVRPDLPHPRRGSLASPRSSPSCNGGSGCRADGRAPWSPTSSARSRSCACRPCSRTSR